MNNNNNMPIICVCILITLFIIILSFLKFPSYENFTVANKKQKKYMIKLRKKRPNIYHKKKMKKYKSQKNNNDNYVKEIKKLLKHSQKEVEKTINRLKSNNEV